MGGRKVILPGSVMIRPIFGGAINVGVNTIPKPNFTATVFPNPASSTINVSIHAKQPSSYSFQLFDAIGKLVAQQKETTINLFQSARWILFVENN